MAAPPRLTAAILFTLALATPLIGQSSPSAQSESIQLDVAGTRLYGTLEIPAGDGPFDVALILAGSGPTDRNGNTPVLKAPNHGLKLLALELARSGIASARYDKRGIGQSGMAGMSEADLKFTMYAEDAAAWIAHLRKDPRFRRVFVIGHSEGALIGTLAVRQAGADGLVLVAGAGRPIGQVLRAQLTANAPALAARAEPILVELENGRDVPAVPQDLLFLFRPSIQPYMKSWLPLDPAAELSKVDAPRLVIRGTTDVQADSVDARRLGQAGAGVRVVMVEGMNHVLKMAGGSAQEQLATSYVDPDLPIAPGLVEAIVRFVREKR